MSEDSLIRFASPTLAGLKTGSLFGYPCKCAEEACRDVREINHLLSPKGIIALPLAFQQDRVLLYIYRPALLRRDLGDPRARSLLADRGYPLNSMNRCICTLSGRLKAEGTFPHEIGLFLGYPPEDVEGFVNNKAANFKCSGTWKVYGNEEKAKAAFNKYRKCTECYVKQHERGTSLSKLAVSFS
ncbi:MAG: DUF3793 family protein [Lachnospiraceae bacterium]|nr:DUF3793 family protein [Lachnospiraceae bacterium]